MSNLARSAVRAMCCISSRLGQPVVTASGCRQPPTWWPGACTNTPSRICLSCVMSGTYSKITNGRQRPGRIDLDRLEEGDHGRKEEVRVTAYCCKGQEQEGRETAQRQESRSQESAGPEPRPKESRDPPQAGPAAEGTISCARRHRPAYRARAEQSAGPDGAGRGDLRQRERRGDIGPHHPAGSRASTPAPGA